jgi:hypothetical protein
MSYENPWKYNDEIIDDNVPEDAVSFVYRITNLISGRQYLGKKTLSFRKTRAPLKGKKRKRKSYTDSGWREYYGSNLELNEERTLIGNHNFKREILRFCKTKGEASYYEAKYIFGEDAIIKETYYNQWCTIKVSKSHIRL